MKLANRHTCLWGIFGPLMLISTLLVAFAKSALLSFVLPLVATVGLFLSWRYKVLGMGVSALFIFAFTVYEYPQLTADQRFWQVGLSLSFVLAHLITALGSEEIEGKIRSLELESNSRLDHLRRLDQKVKQAIKTSEYEKEKFQIKLSQLQRSLAEKSGKVEAQEETIALMREEFKALRADLSETEKPIDPSLVAEMEECIETLSREKELLQSSLKRLQQERVSTR